MGLERIEVVPVLPRRRPEGHKGDYGSILVIAGGRGMAGAAALIGA
ncbi:MAG: NAD(P)H-hydrate dehydratase, partial [Isosphaeraceae bacterium]|nr:NAD(P)H-hydrate dehydratase [Isosphaeraceae bacterium]